MIVAALVWWHARAGGFFSIPGLGGAASDNLGPMLPALCGGITVALALLVADAAAGTIAGLIAAVMIVALPGFMRLHASSLVGPPLLAVVMAMCATMIHAPRFSIAYGTIGAVGGFFVATEGVGLPLAAAAWALLQGNGAPALSRDTGRWQRVVLSLIPAVVVLVLAHLLGGAWPHGVVYGWRGGLDRGLRAAGAILGNQLAPSVSQPALRFLVIADLALIVIALLVVGWRRAGRQAPATSPLRRIFPVAGLLMIGLAIGLAGRTLLVTGTPEPDLAAVLPLVVLTVLALSVSLAWLWRYWPTWGRGVALVIGLGWLQAALRS
ncbi:MAG TPA: hypothetical protein VGL65_13640 [Gemmatimonadales bacterium]